MEISFAKGALLLLLVAAVVAMLTHGLRLPYSVGPYHQFRIHGELVTVLTEASKRALVRRIVWGRREILGIP